MGSPPASCRLPEFHCQCLLLAALARTRAPRKLNVSKEGERIILKLFPKIRQRYQTAVEVRAYLDSPPRGPAHSNCSNLTPAGASDCAPASLRGLRTAC